VPEDGGEVPEDGGEVPEDGGEVPEDGGEVPEDGGEVPEDGGEVPEDGSEVPPVEVTVDEETGQITLPPTEIELTEADGITPTDLEIKIPDLTQPLVIDGKELPSIMEQLEETLVDVGMPKLSVTQEEGIVNVTGSGDLEGTNFAFVPDEETIVQVEEGTPVGVTQDENGFYVVVTADGIGMTLCPAPKSPVQLLKLAKGKKKGKGKLKKKKHGAFHFPVVGYGNVAAMFEPMIMPAPIGMLPGIFIEGMLGTVVYPDGTMQVMHPAMPEIAQLQVATMAFLGVEIIFEYQANGIAEFEFNGKDFKAVPTFEVVEDNTSQPVMEVVDAEAGEQVETLNEQGELVSQEVIAKAILTTEEGTQELNVVEDVTNPEADNGETTTDDNTTVPEAEDTTDTSNTSEPTTDESNVPVTDDGSDTTTTDTGDTTDEGTEPVTNATPETTSDNATDTETTTNSNETDSSGTTDDGTGAAVEDESGTTEGGTDEVTNDSTESVPDTTPEADSTTNPSADSDNDITTVSEQTAN
jgi:hypothetical protein